MRKEYSVFIVVALLLASFSALAATGDKDPRGWRAEFAEGTVTKSNIFPGVDLALSGNQQKMISTMTVHPGMSADAVRIEFPGITKIETGPLQTLVFAGSAVIRVLRPALFQEIDGKRQNVQGSFVQLEPKALGIDAGTFNRSYPLMISFITIFPEGDLFGSETPESGIPSVGATLTDLLVVDGNSNSIANPGDVLEYTTQIDNTGSDGANDVDFTITLDANTTLLPGSVQTTPLAFDDSYDAIGNVPLSVNAAGGVLANDEDPDGDALTVVDADTVSNQGGDVAVASDGSFTYASSAGFTGSDFFTYTLQDDDSNQRTAMVTVQVDSLIWFVDNSESNGNGRFGSPFDNLADAQDATPGGDYVFVYAGSGSYDGGLSLDSGQRLIGQGVSLTVSGTLIVSAGSRPTITNSSGTGITLGGSNTIRGLNVLGTSGAGISGSGDLTMNKAAVGNAGGAALDLASGALSVTLDSLGSSGSAASGLSLTAASGSLTVTGTSRISVAGAVGLNIASSSADVSLNSVDIDNGSGGGIRLTGNSGSITLSGGDVSNVSGTALEVDGGSATVTYGGTITNSAGRCVLVKNRVGGTVTLSGSLSCTASGILIDSNSGGTTLLSGSSITLNTGSNDALTLTGNTGHSVNITGGSLDLDVNPLGTGLRASGGGTLTIAGGNNTINGGAVLDIDALTVDLTFSSLVGNGPSSNSLDLTNLGAGSSLTVSGNSTFANSGGRPINVENLGSGASLTFSGLTTTSNPTSLENIRLSGSSAGSSIQFGQTSVNNRKTTGVLIQNWSGSADFGVVTIANPNNAGGHGIRIENSSGAITLASVTILSPNQTVPETDGNADGVPDNDGDGDGIFLKDNTGSLTINGGSIQNAEDHGIDIRNCSTVLLNNLTINDIGLLSNNPATVAPDAIFALNISDSLFLTGCTIEDFDYNASSRGLDILNVGTSIAGAIRVKNTSFDNSGSGGSNNGDDGISLTARGSVSGSLSITDDFSVGHGSHKSSFDGLNGDGLSVSIGESSGSGSVDVFVQNIEFVDAVNPNGRGGVSFRSTGNSIFDDIEVRNCSFDNLFNFSTQTGIIDLLHGGNSVMAAIVDGNTISGNSTVGNTGAPGIAANNISTLSDNVGDFDLTISNNTINDTERQGVEINVGSNSTGMANVSIINNVMGTTLPVAQQGVEGIRIRFDSLGGFKTMNLLMTNNTVVNADAASGDETVEIRCQDNTTVNATVVGNDFTSANGLASDEFEITTFDPGSTICLDLRDNTASQPGGSGNGSFHLDESAGTFQVEGPGSATVTAFDINVVLNNASGSVDIDGTPTFNNNANCMEP